MTRLIKITDAICDKFSYVALAATFFLMCMMSIHVILRKFTSSGGISASLELTEVSMVVIVFCALAYLQANDGHVRVSMFADLLPPPAKKILNFVILIISAVVLFVMAYAAARNIGTQFASGAQTQVWKIPLWPFVVLTAVGLLLYALRVFLSAVSLLTDKRAPKLNGDDIDGQ
ncbi:MAG: TRAP transporter small permease [Clostridiales Family XIII bacterium]|nr:TRAP transporter small permease [Clostridiales Family XIII bacterium]